MREGREEAKFGEGSVASFYHHHQEYSLSTSLPSSHMRSITRPHSDHSNSPNLRDHPLPIASSVSALGPLPIDNCHPVTAISSPLGNDGEWGWQSDRGCTIGRGLNVKCLPPQIAWSLHKTSPIIHVNTLNQDYILQFQMSNLQYYGSK